MKMKIKILEPSFGAFGAIHWRKPTPIVIPATVCGIPHLFASVSELEFGIAQWPTVLSPM